VSTTAGPYDARRAAAYWSGPRHEVGDELASVLSLGEPPAVNEAYDAWETGLVLRTMGEGAGRLGLDVGAGVGRVAIRLAPRLGRVACVDLAPGMLERLRANADRAGIANADPLRSRSDSLPFASASFDAAVCLGLLEHLPRPVQTATIAEIARVLRPGGLFWLVLNNPESVLLADTADNPYRDGLQRESGYYCSVVSEPALLEEAAVAFRIEILGSNLIYSLQRHAARLLPDQDRRSPKLAPFFERAAAWDLALRPIGQLARAAADHHLYGLVRR
jgi:ubiquinone/menaquinone biosynthesis C-methylase UbiE